MYSTVLCSGLGAEAPVYFMYMFMRGKLIHGGLKSIQFGTEHHKETLWESGSVSYVCIT